MLVGLPFRIVDVFAEKKYQGNQLAVVMDAGLLSEDLMQAIAKEMNYSETTFILTGGALDSTFGVRIFTPEKEVPFAGHPTLGTAFVIQQEIIGKLIDQINLDLSVGLIPITFNYEGVKVDTIWMEQKSPTFGNVLDPNSLSAILNILPADIDLRFPIQEVSTGLPFIIVPLKTLDAVRRSHVDKERLLDLVANTDAKAILIFSSETYDKSKDLNVRVFADYYGVPEDPATGSGNGCLAAYLVKYRYFESDEVDVRVEQGYEIGRQSLLYLQATTRQHDIEVRVGGRVIPVAKGELV